jgi:hypothetical protein
VATSDAERPRRFPRRRADDGPLTGDDRLDALHAELVLLREENARLKAAVHKGPDIEALLARTRALSAARADDAVTGDEAERVLVEGLVMRESLLEICRGIGRAMQAFDTRLRALHDSPQDRLPVHLRAVPDATSGVHWAAPPFAASDPEAGRDRSGD